jgi:hypothetical protein
MMQNEATQRASAQNEVNSYRNYLNSVANTNLRRSEGDSMDRYRTGDIDVRRLDTTGMNDYRRGMITNDNTRIGSQERLGTLQSNNQYNLGLNTNQASITNTARQAQANELNSNNQYNLGLDSNITAVTNTDRSSRASETNTARQAQANEYGSANQLALGTLQSNNQYTLGMDANRSLRENARLQYDQLNARDKAIYDTYGAAGLRPQDPNAQLMQQSNLMEQQNVFANALNARSQKNLEDLNSSHWFWGDDPQVDQMQNWSDGDLGGTGLGMSREAAARKMAVQQLTPLYGRSSEVPAQQQAPQNLPTGTNQIQTFGAPGSLSYDNFKEFQQRRNQGR